MKQVRYEKTHNLTALVYLLNDSDADVPEWLHETFLLTPYATTICEEAAVAPFDRAETVDLIQRVRSRAEEQVAQES